MDTPGFPSYCHYTIRTDKRDALREGLDKLGIDTKVYYPLALHLQIVYEYLGYKPGDFPVAESLQDKVLSLPLYPEMTEKQVEYIAESIRKVINEENNR